MPVPGQASPLPPSWPKPTWKDVWGANRLMQAQRDLEYVCPLLGLRHRDVRRAIEYDVVHESINEPHYTIWVADELKHELEHGWGPSVFWRRRHGLAPDPLVGSIINDTGSTPVLRGTQISISTILTRLAEGYTVPTVAALFNLTTDILYQLLREMAQHYQGEDT